jgi:hypothetical protein
MAQRQFKCNDKTYRIDVLCGSVSIDRLITSDCWATLAIGVLTPSGDLEIRKTYAKVTATLRDGAASALRKLLQDAGSTR